MGGSGQQTDGMVGAFQPGKIDRRVEDARFVIHWPFPSYLLAPRSALPAVSVKTKMTFQAKYLLPQSYEDAKRVTVLSKGYDTSPLFYGRESDGINNRRWSEWSIVNRGGPERRNRNEGGHHGWIQRARVLISQHWHQALLTLVLVILATPSSSLFYRFHHPPINYSFISAALNQHLLQLKPRPIQAASQPWSQSHSWAWKKTESVSTWTQIHFCKWCAFRVALHVQMLQDGLRYMHSWAHDCVLVSYVHYHCSLLTIVRPFFLFMLCEPYSFLSPLSRILVMPFLLY